jgi:hypothetical protein
MVAPAGLSPSLGTAQGSRPLASDSPEQRFPTQKEKSDMTNSYRRIPHLAVLASILAMLAITLLISAGSASASGYCGGAVLSNFGTCHGAARSQTEVRGMGNSHSVCIGAGIIRGNCSGGPGQWVSTHLNTEGPYYAEPWIEDNAAGSTTVWGESF